MFWSQRNADSGKAIATHPEERGGEGRNLSPEEEEDLLPLFCLRPLPAVPRPYTKEKKTSFSSKDRRKKIFFSLKAGGRRPATTSIWSRWVYAQDVDELELLEDNMTYLITKEKEEVCLLGHQERGRKGEEETRFFSPHCHKRGRGGPPL